MSTEVEYMVVRRNGVVVCQSSKRVQALLENIGLHSPDGFEMGYGGSGPSDLALTILLDFFGGAPDLGALRSGDMDDAQRLAWDMHHAFKRKFIEPHHNVVLIRSRQIDAFVKKELNK